MATKWRKPNWLIKAEEIQKNLTMSTKDLSDRLAANLRLRATRPKQDVKSWFSKPNSNQIQDIRISELPKTPAFNPKTSVITTDDDANTQAGETSSCIESQLEAIQR